MALEKYFGSVEFKSALMLALVYLKGNEEVLECRRKSWDASYKMDGEILNDSEVTIEVSPSEVGGAEVALCYETRLSNCRNKTFLAVGNVVDVAVWIEGVDSVVAESICRELYRSNDMSFHPYDLR